MVIQKKEKLVKTNSPQSETKSSAWTWLDDATVHEKQGLNFPQVEPSLLKFETPHSLDGKIPMVPGSAEFVKLYTTKLGTKRFLVPPDAEFDLSNPCYASHGYNFLHDPHLNEYLNNPSVKKTLVEKGLITKEGHVKCSIKEFNDYRQWIRKLKLDSLDQDWHLKQASTMQNTRAHRMNDICKQRQERAKKLYQQKETKREAEKINYLKKAEEKQMKIEKMKRQAKDECEYKKKINNMERKKKRVRMYERENEGKRIRLKILLNGKESDEKRKERIQNSQESKLTEKEQKAIDLWRRKQAYSLAEMNELKEQKKTVRYEREERIQRRSSVYEKHRRKSEAFMMQSSAENRENALKHLKEAEKFIDRVEAKKAAEVKKWKKRLKNMNAREEILAYYRRKRMSQDSGGGQRRGRKNKRYSVWDVDGIMMEQLLHGFTDDERQELSDLCAPHDSEAGFDEEEEDENDGEESRTQSEANIENDEEQENDLTQVPSEARSTIAEPSSVHLDLAAHGDGPSLITFDKIVPDDVINVYSEGRRMSLLPQDNTHGLEILEIPGLVIQHTASKHGQAPCMFHKSTSDIESEEEQVVTIDAIDEEVESEAEKEIPKVDSVVESESSIANELAESSLINAVAKVLVQTSLGEGAKSLGYSSGSIYQQLGIHIEADEDDAASATTSRHSSESLREIVSTIPRAASSAIINYAKEAAELSMMCAASSLGYDREEIAETLGIDSHHKSLDEVVEDYDRCIKNITNEAVFQAAVSLGYSEKEANRAIHRLIPPPGSRSSESISSSSYTLHGSVSSITRIGKRLARSAIEEAAKNLGMNFDNLSGYDLFRGPRREAPVLVHNALRCAALSLGYAEAEVDAKIGLEKVLGESIGSLPKRDSFENMRSVAEWARKCYPWELSVDSMHTAAQEQSKELASQALRNAITGLSAEYDVETLSPEEELKLKGIAHGLVHDVLGKTVTVMKKRKKELARSEVKRLQSMALKLSMLVIGSVGRACGHNEVEIIRAFDRDRNEQYKREQDTEFADLQAKFDEEPPKLVPKGRRGSILRPTAGPLTNPSTNLKFDEPSIIEARRVSLSLPEGNKGMLKHRPLTPSRNAITKHNIEAAKNPFKEARRLSLAIPDGFDQQPAVGCFLTPVRSLESNEESSVIVVPDIVPDAVPDVAPDDFPVVKNQKQRKDTPDTAEYLAVINLIEKASSTIPLEINEDEEENESRDKFEEVGDNELLVCEPQKKRASFSVTAEDINAEDSESKKDRKNTPYHTPSFQVRLVDQHFGETGESSDDIKIDSSSSESVGKEEVKDGKNLLECNEKHKKRASFSVTTEDINAEDSESKKDRKNTPYHTPSFQVRLIDQQFGDTIETYDDIKIDSSSSESVEKEEVKDGKNLLECNEKHKKRASFSVTTEDINAEDSESKKDRKNTPYHTPSFQVRLVDQQFGDTIETYDDIKIDSSSSESVGQEYEESAAEAKLLTCGTQQKRASFSVTTEDEREDESPRKDRKKTPFHSSSFQTRLLEEVQDEEDDDDSVVNQGEYVDTIRDDESSSTLTQEKISVESMKLKEASGDVEHCACPSTETLRSSLNQNWSEEFLRKIEEYGRLEETGGGTEGDIFAKLQSEMENDRAMLAELTEYPTETDFLNQLNKKDSSLLLSPELKYGKDSVSPDLLELYNSIREDMERLLEARKINEPLFYKSIIGDDLEERMNPERLTEKSADEVEMSRESSLSLFPAIDKSSQISLTRSQNSNTSVRSMRPVGSNASVRSVVDSEDTLTLPKIRSSESSHSQKEFSRKSSITGHTSLPDIPNERPRSSSSKGSLSKRNSSSLVVKLPSVNGSASSLAGEEVVIVTKVGPCPSEDRLEAKISHHSSLDSIEITSQTSSKPVKKSSDVKVSKTVVSPYNCKPVTKSKPTADSAADISKVSPSEKLTTVASSKPVDGEPTSVASLKIHTKGPATITNNTSEIPKVTQSKKLSNVSLNEAKISSSNSCNTAPLRKQSPVSLKNMNQDEIRPESSAANNAVNPSKSLSTTAQNITSRLYETEKPSRAKSPEEVTDTSRAASPPANISDSPSLSLSNTAQNITSRLYDADKYKNRPKSPPNNSDVSAPPRAVSPPPAEISTNSSKKSLSSSAKNVTSRLYQKERHRSTSSERKKSSPSNSKSKTAQGKSSSVERRLSRSSKSSSVHVALRDSSKGGSNRKTSVSPKRQTKSKVSGRKSRKSADIVVKADNDTEKPETYTAVSAQKSVENAMTVELELEVENDQEEFVRHYENENLTETKNASTKSPIDDVAPDADVNAEETNDMNLDASENSPTSEAVDERSSDMAVVVDVVSEEPIDHISEKKQVADVAVKVEEQEVVTDVVEDEIDTTIDVNTMVEADTAAPIETPVEIPERPASRMKEMSLSGSINALKISPTTSPRHSSTYDANAQQQQQQQQQQLSKRFSKEPIRRSKSDIQSFTRDPLSPTPMKHVPSPPVSKRSPNVMCSQSLSFIKNRSKRTLMKSKSMGSSTSRILSRSKLITDEFRESVHMIGEGETTDFNELKFNSPMMNDIRSVKSSTGARSSSTTWNPMNSVVVDNSPSNAVVVQPAASGSRHASSFHSASHSGPIVVAEAESVTFGDAAPHQGGSGHQISAQVAKSPDEIVQNFIPGNDELGDSEGK